MENVTRTSESGAEENEAAMLKIKIDPPSAAEIRTAVKNLKDGKAPGIDAIPPEFFSANSSTTAELLQPIVAMAWNQEELPSDWKRRV